MSRQHYIPLYPAETFGIEDTDTISDENQRSKSLEHRNRLCYDKNSRKTEKIEENKI